MGAAPAVEFEHARRASLRYLNLFRLVIAGLFLVAGRELGLGSENPSVFRLAALGYLGAVLALGFPDAMRRFGSERVILLQVVVDVLALSAIMWVSGGYRSGMPVLMMVVLAGAGLVFAGRMVLFFAALATLAVLLENAWRLAAGRQSVEFFQVGLFCAGFFGIALVARLLALRAQANASLAAERGEALANQQAVNEHIIRDLPDGVIVVDAGGRIRQANPRAVELLGMAPAEALEGRVLVELDAAFGPALSRGGTEDGGEAEAGTGTLQAAVPGRMLRSTVSGRLLRCRAVAGASASAAAGDTLLYLTDFEDIQRQLQQIKLAALGRLTASIAHEIRNPLSAVIQAAELLGEERRQEVQARLVRIINDNAQRIGRMVRDVLALGRREQALPEALALAAFVRELIEARVFRNAAEHDVYAVDIDPALTLAIDRAHLHQILDNLLANACRHGSGAPASVRLWAQALPGERVAVHVCDDGPGLDEAARAHLFEPFFTTHSKGTGLGLYIARELAEANDATLELAASGAGADFVLTGRITP
ncbi:PAS domain-containing sensor histidine kinase [Thauera aromatica]|uniref:sensor histidine kinase n=1 Tax=Thauera aromatica TaxID=59405 RepID=UPI001FFCAC74|nr:PAS domain-containing sensor histidine kinase [Thauera aromatica]MCK2087380.1 PAS domain-containing sensor histidine kinase [Thauera aromatica]